MDSRRLDWALLLLLSFLLPLHLLFLAVRHLTTKPNNNNYKVKIQWILISIPLLLSATIFSLSDLNPSSNDDGGFSSELEDMKLKIARLESKLEENTKILNSRILHLDENNMMIEEMEQKMQFLQHSLSKIKASQCSSSDSEIIVKAMEEEVRLLWAESRKNNFNYHILESKAYEEEKNMEAVTSDVVKMENIVTEQWIQIRQLEQSLQMMKIMTSKVHKKSTSKVHTEKLKCIVLKFIKGIRHHYFPEVADLPNSFFLGNYISKSCISRVFGQLRRLWSAAKRWHHELQDLVKWEMETNEFTAPLANKEVVFFVASAIISIPIIFAWLLCS